MGAGLLAHTEKIAARRAVALSVVVPCYNEIGGVAELYRRVTAVCREQAGHSYEIVLVIDGATDGTREAIFELAKQDSHVVGIDLARNYGQRRSGVLPRPAHSHSRCRPPGPAGTAQSHDGKDG
nr:glycosyltransferase [Mesorhizobium sp.]